MAAAAAKAAAAAISAGTAVALCSERAHAEGGPAFRFPGFSSPTPPPAAPPPPQPSPAPAAGRREEAPEEAPSVSKLHPRTSAPGFDPAPLERGVEMLRELEKSPNSKKLFELMKKQEETRQQEIAARKTELQKGMAELELVIYFYPVTGGS
uniref:ATPase family AAA domain-containing protein n=1 Tax=Arundo donax TaxID=35708 RepID=A0A0A9CXY2_ARUDO